MNINSINKNISIKEHQFSLLLFSVSPSFINKAKKAGINHVVIDLETRGKKIRQKGYDTQINQNSFEDILSIKDQCDVHIITRINGFWEKSIDEINKAIDFQTDEILLPMVRSLAEVEFVLEIIKNRCKLGIMIETFAASKICKSLSHLPLSRIYVGLNDLGIDRKIPNIFISLVDGTIDEIRGHFSQPFDFGGLTLPYAGSPVPCQLLISENARLKTQFSILRRSFFRDVAGKNLYCEIINLHNAIDTAFLKSNTELEKDHLDLIKVVNNLTAI